MLYEFVGTVNIDKRRKALNKVLSDFEHQKPDRNKAETRFNLLIYF